MSSQWELVRTASPSHFLSHWRKKREKWEYVSWCKHGLEVKSYGPCGHKGELNRGGKGSYAHQSTWAGAAQSTKGVVADVVWIMSGGGAWNPLPAECLSVRGERWERKGRLFCLSRSTSSPQNCLQFLVEPAGFVSGYFHFALRIFLKFTWML